MVWLLSLCCMNVISVWYFYEDTARNNSEAKGKDPVFKNIVTKSNKIRQWRRPLYTIMRVGLSGSCIGSGCFPVELHLICYGTSGKSHHLRQCKNTTGLWNYKSIATSIRPYRTILPNNCMSHECSSLTGLEMVDGVLRFCGLPFLILWDSESVMCTWQVYTKSRSQVYGDNQ